ncbi:MAG: hypothetical protein ACRC3Y_08845 [Romboutsia sp.]|uniref:hypothetical protein n=1 Tax=Romboutsia sp. TaxID=1965302 RepID=UPI003F2D4458
MQKMGINKFKNNNKKHFDIITKSETINIENIKEINSIIIKPSIIDINQIKNSSKLRLTIKTDIKIIYLKQEDSSLYIYKNNYINYKTINLPKILEGHVINNPGILNKIKKDIYVENINTKTINSDVVLSYFLVVNISIPPTHGIAYIINNGFGDNIFLSHINGQNLIQKTFNQNIKYKNIKWNNNTFNIMVIGKCDNKDDIFSIEIENKNVNKITNVNNYKHIDDFEIINKNEIMVAFSDENQVCKLNIKKNKIQKIIKDQWEDPSKKPHYDSKNKCTYILMGQENNTFLYVINESKDVDIIFNYVNILKYYVSYYCNNLIVQVIKDESLSLFEVNLDSKFVSPINLNYDYEDVLNIKYLYDDEVKKQIIILLKNKYNAQNKNSLILYDLNSYTYETLIVDNIVNFDIDYENHDLFIITKDTNLHYVKKLNVKNYSNDYNQKNNIETILKLPATIKEISIKKVEYEK